MRQSHSRRSRALRRTTRNLTALAAIAVIAPLAVAAQSLTGSVRAAGSSTVGPITEAVAEAFADLHEQVRISVTINGTGGGFKKFVAGETDISNASRIIQPDEIKALRDNGIEFIEIPVAFDGITVCVNRANTWAHSLTVDQLREIFREGSNINYWSDINPDWPRIPLSIQMPGTDSGTFDYFDEQILNGGPARSSNRTVDVAVSENDNLLINAIAAERGAIGFFGCSYYFKNREQLRSLAIAPSNDAEPVRPTPRTIESGEYRPLSRPLFIYVNTRSAKRPEIQAFVDFYLKDGAEIAEEVGYVALPSSISFMARTRFNQGYDGSIFYEETEHGLERVEGPLIQLYLDDHRSRRERR